MSPLILNLGKHYNQELTLFTRLISRRLLDGDILKECDDESDRELRRPACPDVLINFLHDLVWIAANALSLKPIRRLGASFGLAIRHAVLWSAGAISRRS